MPEIQVNFFAIGVSVIAVILIGALWYSPLLFGDAWLKGHGYTTDHMKEIAGRNLLFSLISYAVMASVLSVLCSYAGVSSYSHGALMGALVWVGFLATLGMTAHLVLDRPWSIYFIDVGYQFVYSITMGAIIGGWR